MPGGPAAAGGGAADDPYNIPIDLTKIKRTEKPAKTFEEKTSEEKHKSSVLMSKDSGAAGAKGILKKPGQPRRSGKLTFGQCVVH